MLGVYRRSATQGNNLIESEADREGGTVSMNETDVSLIPYCGLHCGDCPNHSGEIADLARDLRKKLREYHFERVAPGLATFFKPFANYEPCYETLWGNGEASE
jgi:hypothetical protein